jgi:hypothetical protein
MRRWTKELVVGMGLLALCAAYGEERVLPTRDYDHSLLLASAAADSSSLVFGAAITHTFTDLPRENGIGSGDIERDSLFLLCAKDKSDSSEDSFVLFRRKMPSRYAYCYWANLQTGYGELFPGDTLGRARTNGVGIEDPHCLYFKLSLKF